MKNTKIVLVAAWDGWCSSCAVERPLVLTRSGRLGLRTWLTAPAEETRPLTLTCRLCGFSDAVPPEADDPPVLISDLAVSQGDAAARDSAAVAAGGTAPSVPSPDALADAGTPALDQSVAAGPAPAVAVPMAVAVPVAVAVPTPAHVAVPLPVAVPVAAAVRPDAELDRTRRVLGAALSALLAQRTAQADAAHAVPAQADAAHAVPAQAVPAQAVPAQAVPAQAVPAQAVPVLSGADRPVPLAPALPPVPVAARPAVPLQRPAPADGDSLATLQLLADGLDLLSSSRP